MQSIQSLFARRAFQAQLPDYKPIAIIYLLGEGYDDEQELHDLLKLSELSTTPVMILALTPTGSETVSEVATKLGVEDRITSQDTRKLSNGYRHNYKPLTTTGL
ncbi:hypothetical protein H0H92_010175 [Tricholoma furcatifolium]|nr:hypothetical protein H0H92_010175 [Tricholoma furcatifolium]